MYRVFGEDVPSGRGMTAEIAGRDRFKFFKRPVVPVIEGSTQTAGPSIPLATRPAVQLRSQHLQTDVGRAQTAGNPNGPNIMKPRTLEKLPGTKTSSQKLPKLDGLNVGSDASITAGGVSSDGLSREIACQTTMRENECQTDPYTPDYFVAEGEQPEVLAIMELRYGEGLPAGLGEIEMVDRVQRRKQVEMNLPQGSDNASMQQRLVALETLEKTEWDERESHIAQLQEQRLEQMEGALHRREDKRAEASKDRVERVKQEKLKQVEAKLQTIQEKRLTATRKLTSKHVNPCAEKFKRDIIDSHVLHGPKGKPVGSNSLVEKINSNNYDVRPTLLSFNEGVQELEKSAVPKIETVKKKDTMPPEEPAVKKLDTNYKKRQARQVLDHLDYANQVIENSHDVKEKAASIQDLYRATPRLQRPDTPTLTLNGDEDEERDEAMLLLQRLLRGRAVQNDFFEGKERCHGLIEELQSASNARDAEKKKPKWLLEKQEEAEQSKRDGLVQSVIDGVQGDVIFGTMDYLHKELLRQQEAAKVNQLRQLAESTRKQREEAERAKREAERAQREKEEEQYRQLVRSTDATAESYLAQTIRHTIRSTARTQALHEQWQAQKDREPVPLNTELDREEYVCDLLDNFIVPQVCKAVQSEEPLRDRSLAHVSMNMADHLGFAVGNHSRANE